MRDGHCLCGWIAYQVAGLPFDPHLCSCRHELRITVGHSYRNEAAPWAYFALAPDPAAPSD